MCDFQALHPGLHKSPNPKTIPRDAYEITRELLYSNVSTCVCSSLPCSIPRSTKWERHNLIFSSVPPSFVVQQVFNTNEPEVSEHQAGSGSVFQTPCVSCLTDYRVVSAQWWIWFCSLFLEGCCMQCYRIIGSMKNNNACIEIQWNPVSLPLLHLSWFPSTNLIYKYQWIQWILVKPPQFIFEEYGGLTRIHCIQFSHQTH